MGFSDKGYWLVLTATVVYAVALYAVLRFFTGFPQIWFGADALPHVVKVEILKSLGLEGLRWFPTYYFGNPHFTFYTPATYILPTAIAVLFDLSYLEITVLLNWMILISKTLTFAGILLLVNHLVKSSNKHMSIIGAGAYLALSPAILEPWLWGGNTPEALTLPTIPWSLLVIDQWITTNKTRFFAAYLFLSTYALTGHQAVGAFLLAASCLWIMSKRTSLLTRLKKLLVATTCSLGLSATYIIPLSYFELSTKIRPDVVERLPFTFQLGDYLPVITSIEVPALGKTTEAYPGTFLILFIAFLITYLKSAKAGVNKRAVLSLSLLSMMLVVHFSMITLFNQPWVAGFHPMRYFTYVVLFSVISLGIILGEVGKRGLTIFFASMAVFTFLFLALTPRYEIRVAQTEISPDTVSYVDRLNASIKLNGFRIGVIDADLFNTISSLGPTLYTSRGYYSQGILFIDWQHWFEYELSQLSKQPRSFNTVMHNLDWTAVRYVVFSTDDPAYATASTVFQRLGEASGFTFFENVYASPVAEVVYNGAVLFFGDREGYDVLLRAVALSDYRSPAPVLVWAVDGCVDDVPAEVLEKFSSIVLYRYCYRDKAAAFSLLDQYVKQGGWLFVETMSSVDESSEMPQPLPVSKTSRSSVEREWGFTISNHELTRNISANIFSPAVYDGGPWGVSATGREALRQGSVPLLVSGDKVLMVYANHGRGAVVWSGMNLPYHALAYQNIQEANLLRRLFSGNTEVEKQPAEMKRESATSITFNTPPKAKGLIFRERYLSNLVFSWKADTGHGGLPVFMYGPGFNYVVLSGDTQTVKLYLSDGPLRTASIATSLSTALAIAAVNLYNRRTNKKPNPA
ncbi:MAG: hypothetical protein NZ941_01050 [Candidatus Caldarchaeum sp.]|nr:hypothetical protein [Candidatus Caldarchaeum sp.]